MTITDIEVKNMAVENPILSGSIYEEATHDPLIISECTNEKCNEDIYSNEGVEFGGRIFCNSHCLGEHLINEGQAVDLSKGY